VIDYPFDGSIFPPEITALTFVWRGSAGPDGWTIRFDFADGSVPIEVAAAGETPTVGEIDARAVEPTNELPSYFAVQNSGVCIRLRGK
jgi:hypothetical protein